MAIILPKIKLFFSFNTNKVFLIPFTGGRMHSFYLPSTYFYKLTSQAVSLVFEYKFYYLSFLAHLRYLMRRA